MSNYAPQPPINPEEESAASLMVKILGFAAVAGAAGIAAWTAKKYVDSHNQESGEDDQSQSAT